MSTIKDKTTGKQYIGTPITTLSASLAASADSRVDGRIHEFIGFDKIPTRIKNGDQSKFVDLTKVVSGSVIRDVERGITYVPFRKKDFQDMTIGNDSFLKSTFNSDSYNSISASFAARFNNVGDNTLLTYLVEEFYTGSEEGFVGSVRASMNSFTPD